MRVSRIFSFVFNIIDTFQVLSISYFDILRKFHNSSISYFMWVLWIFYKWFLISVTTYHSSSYYPSIVWKKMEVSVAMIRCPFQFLDIICFYVIFILSRYIDNIKMYRNFQIKLLQTKFRSSWIREIFIICNLKKKTVWRTENLMKQVAESELRGRTLYW